MAIEPDRFVSGVQDSSDASLDRALRPLRLVQLCAAQRDARHPGGRVRLRHGRGGDEGGRCHVAAAAAGARSALPHLLVMLGKGKC